jgi:hypothetical protein
MYQGGKKYKFIHKRVNWRESEQEFSPLEICATYMLSSRPNKKRREKHENYTRAASSSFLQLKLLTQINKNRLYDDGRRKKKKNVHKKHVMVGEKRLEARKKIGLL